MQSYLVILQQRYVRLVRDQSLTAVVGRQESFPTASTTFLRYYQDRTASQLLVHPVPYDVLLPDISTSDDPGVRETVFRNHFTNLFSSHPSVDSSRLQECPSILDGLPFLSKSDARSLSVPLTNAGLYRTATDMKAG